MGIHPAFADRFQLLDGIPSIEAAMADPELEPVERVLELMADTVRGGVPSAITPTP